MRVTPKIRVSPEAIRKRTIAFARPLNNWTRRSGALTPARDSRDRSASGAELLHLVVGGQHLLPRHVLVIGHDAAAALGVEPGHADPRPHRRLAVGGAEDDRPDRRLDLQV